MVRPSHRVHLTIPARAFPQLADIATHAKVLPELSAVCSRPKPTTDPSSIAGRFAARCDLSPEVAANIVDGLLDLQAVRDAHKVGPEELFEALTARLERQAEKPWLDAHLKAWKGARAAIIDALHVDHALTRVNKTIELAYAHQYVLADARIITDLRPVFDTGGTKLQAAVISHVLMLDYADGTESGNRIHIALDAADISKLKALCERAEKKASALRGALKGEPWPVLVAGEEDCPADG